MADLLNLEPDSLIHFAFGNMAPTGNVLKIEFFFKHQTLRREDMRRYLQQ